MIEKIFALYERHVIALETIAATLSTPTVVSGETPPVHAHAVGSAPTGSAELTGTMKEAAEAGKAAAQAEKDERAALFARAKAVGLNVGPKTGTDTLKKKVEEAEAAAKKEPAGADDGDDFLNGDEPEAAKAVTIDVVRSALKGYAAKHGKEKTQALMKANGGGADRLKDVAEALYPALFNAAKAELA